jgi:hypothetical protein
MPLVAKHKIKTPTPTLVPPMSVLAIEVFASNEGKAVATFFDLKKTEKRQKK